MEMKFEKLIDNLRQGNDAGVRQLTQDESLRLIAELFQQELAGLQEAAQSLRSVSEAAWLQGKALIARQECTPRFKATWDAAYEQGKVGYSYKSAQRRMDMAKALEFEAVGDKSLTECYRMCTRLRAKDSKQSDAQESSGVLPKILKRIELSVRKSLKQWYDGKLKPAKQDELSNACTVVDELLMELGHFRDALSDELGVEL